MNETDDYARELLGVYPPYRFANADDGKCRDCGKEIGLADAQCTGWHPAFKCECGYETSHPAAAKWTHCIQCRRPVVDILDADLLED